MAVALSAVLGALVGALSPLPAYRLAVAAGTAPRRACPGCRIQYPEGPAGWLRFGGRCRRCRCRPGIRAGPTALLAAGSFGLLAAAVGTGPALPAFLAVGAIGVPLAVIDLACHRLPDRLVAATLVVALGGLVGATVVLGTPDALLRGLAGSAVAGAGYLGLALLPGAGIGFGDVKLAAVLGLPLGWLGWPTLLLGLALPHLLNGPVAVVLLMTGRVRRRSTLALGPALLVGALLASVLSADNGPVSSLLV